MKQFSNFAFQMDTEIVFGKGTELKAGALVHKYGGTKVLLVYGGGSIRRTGLYDRVVCSLKEAGIRTVELSGVQPNPHRSLVDKGIMVAKAEGIDFLLAVGGGSTIDTAKAISFALCYEGDWWDLYRGKAFPQKRIPVGTVHTISAAGSETSSASMIVDDVETGLKFGAGGPLARPVFAIMNPELTYSVSKYQTAAGTTDIFAHTFDRYFFEDDCALGDAFAEGLMRTVVKYGPIAVQEPNNYEARAELMLCGSFSHNDVTGIGHAGMGFAAHALEGVISSLRNSTHGAGLAVVMPAWLEVVAKSDEKGCARVAKMAISVFGVNPDLADLSSVAQEGIMRFRAWLNVLGMPSTLSELGVKESDLPKLTAQSGLQGDGKVGGYHEFSREALFAFYKSIL